ncbi:MAG: inosine/xanthosine triphosphatase [archaeon]
MKINVGSANPVKIKAVKNAFENYFKKVEVKGTETKTTIREQPLNLIEIVNGAKTRAEKAFTQGNCNYSVGIESGIHYFPAGLDYMEITVAAIFDGKEFFFGTSPLFKYPKKATYLLLQGKDDVNTAFAKLFGKEKDIGKKQGAVGELTKRKVDRTKFNEMAVLMALMGIVSKEFFE